MLKLVMLFLFPAFFLSQLKSVENKPKQEVFVEIKTSTVTTFVQNIENVPDPGLLKNLSPIKFLTRIQTSSLQHSNAMQNEIIIELKKIGKVTSKSSSIEHLAEDKKLLRSPSLIYSIKTVLDLDGQSLPFFQVSLVCEASSEITNNKQYGEVVLWGRECFFKQLPNISLETVLSKTLPLLLEEFKSAYLKASDKGVSELDFFILTQEPIQGDK